MVIFHLKQWEFEYRKHHGYRFAWPFTLTSARKNLHQVGIPVDSTNNELTIWINNAIGAFEGHVVNYMIKGDNNARYPSFKGVMDALRANDQFKYKLITDPKGVPPGSDLYVEREKKANSK